MLSRRELLGATHLALWGSASQPLARLVGSDRGITPGSSVSVESYGASISAAPSSNLAAFRAAIAATPSWGTLIIPARGGGTYAIDTSGGLTNALLIDRPMRVVLNGRIRATHGKSGNNPPHLFIVQAADVSFTGSGVMSGPGYVDDTNLLDDQQHAGLIYVTGDRFSFVGPNVTDVPKIGIHLWNCHSAVISTQWRGGVKDYTFGHTALFAIRATGGGQHRIVSNRFERDSQGRRLITGYFTGGLMGGTNGDIVTDNFADVHEKVAYLYTNNSYIARCHVVDALQTDILRVVGGSNYIIDISGKNIKGGISIYNGSHNTVMNCIFEDVFQEGVYVASLGEYTGGFADTIVSGNAIVASADALNLQEGICLYMAVGDMSGIQITRNRIEARGSAVWRNCIRIEALPPSFATGVTVSDNSMSGGVNGLSMRRLRNSEIIRNQATRLGGGKAMLEIGS